MDAVVQLKARSLTTTDLDEAREMLTRQYCSHSIFQKDKRAALDVRYSHSRMLNMSFNTLQYGAEVDIRPREFETFYLVHIPLAGHASIRAGGHCFHLRPGVAAIVSPSHQISTTWQADCRQLMLKIDRKPLENLLSHLIFQPIERPLEFPFVFDLASGLGSTFYGMIHHLAEELANNEAVVKSRLVCAQLEQTLLMLILCGANHSYRDALEAVGGVVIAGMIACEFLDDHRLAHAACADDQKIGHAGARREGDQFLELGQRLAGAAKTPWELSTSLGVRPVNRLDERGLIS